MNIIYILDKEKADKLLSLGYKYKEAEIDSKKVYQFYGTDELLKELNSNFDEGSFLVRKNLCF